MATKKRLLIVDDELIVRELIRESLCFSDFEIYEVNNGEEALDFIEQFLPDVVLLDVLMPGLVDGFQVCESIKSDAESKHIRVVMLSAKNQPEALKKAGEVGADAYFTKPFSPLSLIDSLKCL
jgi:CheY-like chemotaxis protein